MSKVKKIFGGAPKLPPVQAPPQRDTTGLTEEQKKRLSKRRGVASTILTQQRGDELGGATKALGG